MVGIKINKTLRNVLIALAVIILIFAIPSFFPEKDYHGKYDNYDLSTNVGIVSSTKTYSEYLNEHSSARSAKSEVSVDVLDFVTAKSSGTSVQPFSSTRRVSLFISSACKRSFLGLSGS